MTRVLGKKKKTASNLPYHLKFQKGYGNRCNNINGANRNEMAT